MSAPTGYGMGSPTGLSGSGRAGNKIPSGYKAGQLQQFTPEQMQLFQQMFSQVGPDSYTSRLAGGDQSLFDEMEAPAFRQFNELQGNIASRFSGMGTGGRHSSGFQNQATAAGSNFAQDLQSRRQELQRQAIQDLMGMSNNLLNQRPYEQFITEKQNPWADIGGKFASAVPGAVAGYFTGGPPGAVAGAAKGFMGAGGANQGVNQFMRWS